MVAGSLVEPEFVVHLFVSLDGPSATDELAGVRALWENCQLQLGLTQPIVEAGLPADLPVDPMGAPDGALAGLQDPAVQFQAIARRERDVLNFSFAVAAIDAVPRSRPLLGSALPSGWQEFHRWWRLLDAGTALLGGAVVLLAKSPDAAQVDLQTAVPAQDGDAEGWWEAGFSLRDFAAWETTPAGTSGSRRLVVLAGLDQDAELSRFAWSDGGTALPPLGRYLMHAAKLRYLARVRGDGGELTRLRRRIASRLDELTDLLRDPGRASQTSFGATAISGDQAELAATLEAVRVMRRSVEIARGNMVMTLGEPLPSDAILGDWVAEQLADDAEYLQATWERSERVRAAYESASRATSTPLTSPSPVAAAVEHRVGFGIDVVGYSGRSTPQQREVQDRLAGMIERILADVGVPLHQTDRQPSGDGMMLVLPASVEAHVALLALLRGWRAQVVADNGAHPHDRIRLRLSVGSGPFTPSAIGFSGQAIIEIGRLLDSDVLRRAVLAHPDADLVAIVADRIFRDVVGEGYPGLHAGEFELIEVTIKTYRGPAWLWTGGEPSPPRAPERVVASERREGRDVFVIHGSARQPRKDMFELLRALDLRPLGWDDMVARTGRPAPYHREVLETAFAVAPGVLVVITADDVGGQEPDVLMRLGHALALRSDHTVIVKIGHVGTVSDLDGRQAVHLAADGVHDRIVFQHEIARRLQTLGYSVDTMGTDWLGEDRFRGLVVSPSDDSGDLGSAGMP